MGSLYSNMVCMVIGDPGITKDYESLTSMRFSVRILALKPMPL
jgi:hypothetical protein